MKLFFKLMLISLLFIVLLGMMVAKVGAESMAIVLVLLAFLGGIAYMLWMAYS